MLDLCRTVVLLHTYIMVENGHQTFRTYLTSTYFSERILDGKDMWPKLMGGDCFLKKIGQANIDEVTNDIHEEDCRGQVNVRSCSRDCARRRSSVRCAAGTTLSGSIHSGP